MIGTAVDHAISWFSPARAARRAHARAIYGRVVKRGYDAAKLDRTNSNWSAANASADNELSLAANTIRARARDLVRNNAYARGVLKALVRNVVGCGIVPQSRIEGQETLNQTLEDLFQRWSNEADAAGRLTFYEIQRLAYQEMLEAGECIVHFTTRTADRGRSLSLALELIDADRIADDMQSFRRTQATGNEIRRGVEVDETGQPVAYWVYPFHPNDIAGAWARPVRVPASECLHLFRSERIGQTRGVSMFAPVVGWLRNLGFYVENELQASAVASCFTAAIKTLDGPNSPALLSSDSSDSDTDGNTFEYLQPGMVARLLPGEDIEIINPSRPSSNAEPWITLLLRSIAVGSGLSYERMARDYSRTNYSSARASDLEDRREFRMDQDWLVSHLCEPIWQRFIETAVMEGKVDVSAEQLVSQYGEFTAHAWQRPGWEWVDPQKEAAASQLALQANLTTLSDELGLRGRDLYDTLKQRAREKELLDELGLSASEEDQAEGEGTSDAEEGQTAAVS